MEQQPNSSGSKDGSSTKLDPLEDSATRLSSPIESKPGEVNSLGLSENNNDATAIADGSMPISSARSSDDSTPTEDADELDKDQECDIDESPRGKSQISSSEESDRTVGAKLEEVPIGFQLDQSFLKQRYISQETADLVFTYYLQSLSALHNSFSSVVISEERMAALLQKSIPPMDLRVRTIFCSNLSCSQERLREVLNLETEPFIFTRKTTYAIQDLPQEDERRMAFQALFLFMIRPHIPVKFPTVASLLLAYPEFRLRSSLEQEKLRITANWMDLAFYTISPKHNKNFLLNLVPRICEGRGVQYITGQRESPGTSDRVTIFRVEGRCAKTQTKKKKEAERIEPKSETEDESDELSPLPLENEGSNVATYALSATKSLHFSVDRSSGDAGDASGRLSSSNECAMAEQAVDSTKSSSKRKSDSFSSNSSKRSFAGDLNGHAHSSMRNSSSPRSSKSSKAQNGSASTSSKGPQLPRYQSLISPQTIFDQYLHSNDPSMVTNIQEWSKYDKIGSITPFGGTNLVHWDHIQQSLSTPYSLQQIPIFPSVGAPGSPAGPGGPPVLDRMYDQRNTMFSVGGNGSDSILLASASHTMPTLAHDFRGLPIPGYSPLGEQVFSTYTSAPPTGAQTAMYPPVRLQALEDIHKPHHLMRFGEAGHQPLVIPHGIVANGNRPIGLGPPTIEEIAQPKRLNALGATPVKAEEIPSCTRAAQDDNSMNSKDDETKKAHEDGSKAVRSAGSINENPLFGGLSMLSNLADFLLNENTSASMPPAPSSPIQSSTLPCLPPSSNFNGVYHNPYFAYHQFQDQFRQLPSFALPHGYQAPLQYPQQIQYVPHQAPQPQALATAAAVQKKPRGNVSLQAQLQQMRESKQAEPRQAAAPDVNSSAILMTNNNNNAVLPNGQQQISPSSFPSTTYSNFFSSLLATPGLESTLQYLSNNNPGLMNRLNEQGTIKNYSSTTPHDK